MSAVDPSRPVSAASSEGGDSPRTLKRRIILEGLGIFAVAMAVRVLFFTVQLIHGPTPWSHAAPFWQDEMGYISLNLAQGRGFSSPFGVGTTPTAWVCPLVPLLWSLVIKCMGEASGYTARILVYLNTIPSACCVVAYWLIARHVLRKSPAQSRTSLLVAAALCFSPVALYALAFPWYFAWQEVGTALLVLAGMRWIDHPGLKTAMPLAIVGGILPIINVTPAPIFAVALLLPLFQDRKNWRRLLRPAILGASVAFVLVLPWMIRDAVVMHAIIPLRSIGGYELWEGNNPVGCVRETAISRHPLYEPEELPRYEALGEAGYSSQGFYDAVAYIRTHPRETMLRIVERAYVLWLSDAFDQWSWDATKYWQKGRAAIDQALASALMAWGTMIALVWAIASKRLKNLPYKALFVSVLIILPFPYYFTLADDSYSGILRSWELVLIVLAFSAGFRAKAEASAPAQDDASV